MAQNKSITFKGMQRAIPQSLAPEGACHEILNARIRKGCWRPVGDKEPVFDHELDLSYFDQVWVHDIEGGLIDGLPNWIGYNQTSTMLALINPVTGEYGAITMIGEPGTEIRVTFLKRTMIVSSNYGLQTFIWTTDKVYAQITKLPVPNVDLSHTKKTDGSIDYKSVISDPFFDADAVLGGYYKALNSESENGGYMYGSFMYISVYRLFDGSYILPSTPRYFEFSNGGSIYRRNPGGDGSLTDRLFDFRFSLRKASATINNELYPESIGSIKELIESICIFATKCQPLFKIDETNITDTFLNSFSSALADANQPFKNKLPVDDKFTKMLSNAGWYKIHEFEFEEVVGKTGRQIKPIDLTGYYQDYATRDTLPADQFTHHSLNARFAYSYNDRLHLLNIKTSLGLPYVIWPDSTTNYAQSSERSAIVTVWLKSVIGKGIVRSTQKVPVYTKVIFNIEGFDSDYDAAVAYLAALEATPSSNPNYIKGTGYVTSETVADEFTGTSTESNAVTYAVIDSTSSDQYFIIPSVVCYNDSRAYRMQITVNTGAEYVLLFDEKLTKNSLMNFSEWHNSTFIADEASTTANYSNLKRLTSSLVTPITAPEPIELPFDTNRLQVSEIQNPLVFPAKNSYQIGTGDGLAIAAGSEPLSTGQFGQFPLQVFTTKGIWTLEIGTGDVLYTNILPLNAEVINNPNNVVAISSGVCYTTDTGLFVINGRQVIELAELQESLENTLSLQNSDYVSELTSNIKYVPSLSNSLSDTEFIDYLRTSKIGYDHLNKELICTNNSHSYTYVYSFENQIWYKISQSFRMLINSYPKLYGVTNSNVLSLSDENTSNPVDILIMSSAQGLDAPDAFKKIERAIFRSKFTTDVNCQAGFYLFASDDLNTWQFITGKQKTGLGLKDLLIQRSHGSAKYYAFLFAGRVYPNAEIKQIELIFNIRWNNRLR